MDSRFHLASDAVRARRRAARRHSAPGRCLGNASGDTDIDAISGCSALTYGRGLADNDRLDGGLSDGAAFA